MKYDVTTINRLTPGICITHGRIYRTLSFFDIQIPELKRINGLYKDNEFFALTSIKIPVRSHQSMLQEELDKVAQERTTAHNDNLHRKPKCAADIVSSVSTYLIIRLNNGRT